MTTNILIQLIEEHRRATHDGITIEQMESQTETALAGYLAGLEKALQLVEQTRVF
jgi:hypothetical protein